MAEISSETTVHTYECLRRASDHLKEAITLLYCCVDVEHTQPVIWELKPIVKQLEGMVKLG